MAAMLVGETGYIDRDTRLQFQRTGAYHILVVSGMNVGILAFVVFWVLRRVRLGELAASVLTLLLAGGYAYLCDLGAPVVRAVLPGDPLAPERLAARRAAVLDFISAALFRRSGPERAAAASYSTREVRQ